MKHATATAAATATCDWRLATCDCQWQTIASDRLGPRGRELGTRLAGPPTN